MDKLVENQHSALSSQLSADTSDMDQSTGRCELASHTAYAAENSLVLKLQSNNYSRFYPEISGKPVPRQTCSGARLSLESAGLSLRKGGFQDLWQESERLLVSACAATQPLALDSANKSPESLQQMLGCKPAQQFCAPRHVALVRVPKQHHLIASRKNHSIHSQRDVSSAESRSPRAS